ncbi:hypothetical protein E3P91_02032 [Wallemia ichthyophaga]|nr:hypothetical protein E3P91_02032 [Wallemia ichthyophaga]
MDSYMFQTVGLSILPLIAQSLGVELFEGVIKGTPINQSSSYEETLNDETEDLYKLLKSVKEKYADLQGVSVGAILSNYQRVRVEHVCSRLGLTVLAYLWRRPQDKLLDEMVAAQQTSIIIKVAGAGLDPDRHLGKSLAQLRPTLDKLHNLYGAHVCGEGGEFETVTLDSPLYKQRIVLDETEIVYHDPSPTAPVAYLRIKKAHLEPKEGNDLQILVQPELYDDISQKIQLSNLNASTSSPVVDSRRQRDQEVQPRATMKETSKWYSLSNLYPTNSTAGTAEQTRDILQQASVHLQSKNLQLDKHVIFISVYIADMNDFESLNKTYAAHFTRSGPPARACVATALGDGYQVSMSILASTDQSRSALHVRGLSYWAPANIGPYSQCLSINNRHFISGQIALKPSTLSLVEGGVVQQAILSLQHARKVAEGQAPSYIPHGELLMRPESVICYVSSKDYINICRRVLRQAVVATSERSEDFLSIETHEPAQIYVVVSQLPKDAAVEWQFVYNDRQLQTDYDSDDESARKEETLDVFYKDEGIVRKHLAQSHDGLQSFEFFDEGYSKGKLERALACTLYYSSAITFDKVQAAVSTNVTYVPVDAIVDKDGQESQMALSVFTPSQLL